MSVLYTYVYYITIIYYTYVYVCNICIYVCMYTSMKSGPSLFFFYKFIYLFMAVLGLRFCARAFSS